MYSRYQVERHQWHHIRDDVFLFSCKARILSFQNNNLKLADVYKTIFGHGSKKWENPFKSKNVNNRNGRGAKCEDKKAYQQTAVGYKS